MNIADLKKRRVIDEFLKGDHVLIHVDSRNMDAKIPSSFRDNPRLTLKISRLFNYPPELGEGGISVSLKFFGAYEDCYIPWASLWGVTNELGEITIWDNCFIDEVRDESSSSDKIQTTPEERRSGLKRVK